MATSIGTITTVAHRVGEALYDRFSRGGMADVMMVFARYGGHGHFSIEREMLLPLDLGRFRRYLTGAAPRSNLAPSRLIDRLIEEYFFAQLVRGATESFASENAARVAFTQVGAPFDRRPAGGTHQRATPTAPGADHHGDPRSHRRFRSIDEVRMASSKAGPTKPIQ